MKIIKQDKKGNQVDLEIEEQYSMLEPHILTAYEEASKEVKIPGFRQGKVPANIMKKYISEEAVIDRAVQGLISDIYPSIIEEAKIKPVDYPNVEVKKLSKDKPVIFNITVDVYPAVKLGTYKGLKLAKQDASVTDDEVVKTLEMVKKDLAKQSGLQESEVALDDEFAKKVSRSETLQELKELIKSNIETEKKREADMAMRDDVSKKLSEAIELDVPKGMIEREIDSMLHDMEHSLSRNRMTIESYLSAVKKDMDSLRKDLKSGAEIRVKSKLALEAIAEKEKLEVEQADMDKEMSVLAESYGKSLDEYKASLSPDSIESIKDFMLKEKTIDFVISKAKVEGK